MTRVLIFFLFISCSHQLHFQEPSVNCNEPWVLDDVHVGKVTSRWWTVFEDPFLDELIEKAALCNYDIHMAAARLRQARAACEIASASRFPQINSSATVERRHASENAPGGLGELAKAGLAELEQSVYRAGFDASWEVDAFGGNRARTDAAKARVEAAADSRRDIVVTISAEVARNYMELRGNQKRLQVIEQNVQYKEKTLDILKKSHDIGLTRDLDVARAALNLQQTKALLPNIRGEIRLLCYRLSVLTGQVPEGLLNTLLKSKPLPVNPDIVPVGMRSDLLLRRSDLRRAKALLEAAMGEATAARADLFPRFFLTGSAGLEALTFGDLLKSASLAWTLGTLVNWPIFRGGALRANIQLQDARAQEALLYYEKTVLRALEEVEGSLVAYGEELDTRWTLIHAVDAAKRYAARTLDLYEQGIGNYIDVLDGDALLMQAEDALVQSETRALTQLIALYKALGGGWEAQFGV